MLVKTSNWLVLHDTVEWASARADHAPRLSLAAQLSSQSSVLCLQLVPQSRQLARESCHLLLSGQLSSWICQHFCHQQLQHKHCSRSPIDNQLGSGSSFIYNCWWAREHFLSPTVVLEPHILARYRGVSICHDLKHTHTYFTWHSAGCAQYDLPVL